VRQQMYAALVFAAIMAGVLVVAQEPAQAPSLSLEQKQAIVIAAQAVEIAQLRLAQAQADLEKLIAAAQVPGYELTQQLEYRRKVEKGQ
jgi:DNA-binding transcriptional regulator YhcF (GntR family)